jgi:hypothetical protein
MLLGGMGPGNPRRGSAASALLSVLLVTAADLVCARNLSSQMANRQLPRRDYSDRSGFTRSPQEMRNQASQNKASAAQR